MKVEDQYLLSQDDKIKVENLSYTQENVKVDAATGKLIWTITLEPKESKVLSVGYTVRFLKDWDVHIR